MRMAMHTFRPRLTTTLARLFMPREVLVRTNGRIRYVTLSQRSQMAGAGLLLVLIGWLTIGSPGFAVHDPPPPRPGCSPPSVPRRGRRRARRRTRGALPRWLSG